MAGKSRDDGESNPTPIGNWLRRALSVRRGVGKEVAAALGIETSAVSRLRTNKRRVQLSEIPIIESITGERAPIVSVVHRQEEARAAAGNGNALGSELAVTLVRVLVVIAPAVWREVGVSVAVPERVPSSPDPRVSGMKQYACKIETERNKYAICVPYSEMRIKPVAGDVVHVRRTDREGRYEDTLRTIRILPSGKVQLKLEGVKTREAAVVIDFPSKDHGSPSIEIRGLVVGFYDAVPF